MGNMLKDFTDEQLQAEAKRREEIARQERVPKQLQTIDLSPLRRVCQEYIDHLSAGGRDGGDHREGIFEIAVQAFFGESVWKWIEDR